jgi:hypothetical protein
MSLALELENLDGLTDALKGLYIEKDGKFKLDLASEVKTQADIDALSNALKAERALKKSLESKVSKFGTLTPEQVREMQAELERAKLSVKDGDTDEVKQRIEDIKSVYEAKLKLNAQELNELKAKLDEDQAKITNAKFKEELRKELADNVNPNSVQDILKLAQGEIKYNKDADTFQSTEGKGVKEWVADFLKQRPYFLKDSTAGGSKGSKQGQTVVNPFAKETFNMTQQAVLLRENPALAKRLKDEVK